jgi:hypothetical protein
MRRDQVPDRGWLVEPRSVRHSVARVVPPYHQPAAAGHGGGSAL